MDHVGEAARTTTAGSTELGMAGAVRGSQANIGSGAFAGQLGAALASFSDFDLSPVAGRGVVPVDVLSHLHQEPGPGAVAYPNDIGAASWRRLGPVDVVVLVGPQLPGVVVPAHSSYGYYSALQPRPGPGARRGVVLGDLLPGGGGAVYNWEAFVGLLPGGVGAAHDDYVLQPRPGAGHGEVLVDQLHDGAGHGEVFVGLLPGGVGTAHDDYGYNVLGPRPGAGHGEVLVDQLHDGAGHGDVFVGLLPGGVGAAHGDYGYYALQPRPAARHEEVFVDQLHDGAGHGEAFVGLLPGGVDAGYHNYGYYALQLRSGAGYGEVLVGLLRGGGVAVPEDYAYYPWQPRPGAGRDEVFIGPLPDGVSQTLLRTGSADGIAAALRDPNLGAGYDGSLALADDLGAGYDNRGMVAEHLRRLLPFAGIGACSVAINGLAAAPGSPTAAFNLFALLLGGLFLVILHVLRV